MLTVAGKIENDTFIPVTKLKCYFMRPRTTRLQICGRRTRQIDRHINSTQLNSTNHLKKGGSRGKKLIAHIYPQFLNKQSILAFKMLTVLEWITDPGKLFHSLKILVKYWIVRFILCHFVCSAFFYNSHYSWQIVHCDDIMLNLMNDAFMHMFRLRCYRETWSWSRWW